MQFKTKFNIGDTVHFMHSNKPTISKVHKITVDISSSGSSSIFYLNDPDDYKKLKGLHESFLFSSKEELIKSL